MATLTCWGYYQILDSGACLSLCLVGLLLLVGTLDVDIFCLLYTGGSIGVDVSALYKEDDFLKYSITMTSYGFYGDLLEDSERRRWMGSLRYVFSGQSVEEHLCNNDRWLCG